MKDFMSFSAPLYWTLGQHRGAWKVATLATGTTCASSLHDGIADQWRIKHGLSTTDRTLYKAIAPNGYTYLENYLTDTDPNVM
jgi:hypothetical protein